MDTEAELWHEGCGTERWCGVMLQKDSPHKHQVLEELPDSLYGF